MVELFRVKLFCECRRADQVTKQHPQVTAFTLEPHVKMLASHVARTGLFLRVSPPISLGLRRPGACRTHDRMACPAGSPPRTRGRGLTAAPRMHDRISHVAGPRTRNSGKSAAAFCRMHDRI